MPIINPNPVVIPPTPEVTYPHIWLYNVMIHAPSIDTGRITVEALPYNADTQSIAALRRRLEHSAAFAFKIPCS